MRSICVPEWGRRARILPAVATLWTSRSFLTDLGFVLSFSALHVLDLVVTSPVQDGWWWPILVSFPATCVLLVRRRFPWLALLVPLGVATGLCLLQLPIGALNLVILVGLYTICVRDSLAAAVGAAALAMVYPSSKLVYLEVGEGLLTIIGGVVNLIMVVGWGRAMRVGHQRARQLKRTISLLDEARDQIASDAAVVERARIAREFHDIVSHNLSVVALRAGVARALVDQDPGHARETLRELEQTSSAALGEMRTLLGALRDSGDDAGGDLEQRERRPAPTLDRVEALVDSVRDSEVNWRLERRGAVRDLGTGLEMTAYRIVQEAVTNVLKHAEPGHARVLLDYGQNALTVEITNHVTATPSDDRIPPHANGRVPPTPGHGLIGLRERVALLGGTLTAHPIPGGFHLAAMLPFSEPAGLT